MRAPYVEKQSDRCCFSSIPSKKHMGSRAILFLFKDHACTKKYTGFETLGVIYTRRGRRFFDFSTEQQMITKIYQDLHESGWFTEYKTEYLLLDAEILPWNLKVKDLSNRKGGIA
ncbi:hypothetical protein J9303_06765 [Bacillaceae bacterium Marseille-Q3522]|nr:hypothetical protein [Bacillaceae bacterium Marseille-Q3522]